jgi:hypothetical protein
MFSKRSALFAGPPANDRMELDKLIDAEAIDIVEMKNNQRQPLSEVIADIFVCLDAIGYVQVPNYESSPSEQSGAQGSEIGSAEDSDVMLI